MDGIPMHINLQSLAVWPNIVTGHVNFLSLTVYRSWVCIIAPFTKRLLRDYRKIIVKAQWCTRHVWIMVCFSSDQILCTASFIDASDSYRGVCVSNNSIGFLQSNEVKPTCHIIYANWKRRDSLKIHVSSLLS